MRKRKVVDYFKIFNERYEILRNNMGDWLDGGAMKREPGRGKLWNLDYIEYCFIPI